MADEDQHRASVDAWLKGAGEGEPAQRLLAVFEEGFDALWQRAHRTLGDVTLTAIADRVLHNASEQYPSLATLRIVSTGLHYEDLRAHAAGLDREQLLAAIRFVMVEFLTVVGVLTAEILTPALHAELAKLAPETASRTDSGTKNRARHSEKPRGEESKS